jgi:serine/threonine-protein kinase
VDADEVRRWREADRLHAEWIELDPDQRAEWWERLQASAEVREILSRLVNRSGRDQEATAMPIALAQALVGDAGAHNQLAGRRLGHWELIEEIGRGGMSVVYRARRVGIDFEQLAAVKLLGFAVMGTDGGVRFERERRVLARLRHPHIAALIDGGFADDGTPYLVMPLIIGQALDRHCDERRLDWRDRVRLMVQVCDAVAHAHQNLLVHRDLKPANILVAADGVPTLLDFGIAKLLDDSNDLTRTGVQAMTPGYAAPEQKEGGVITTATDVHALGVMLERLCEGHSLPSDLRNIIAMAQRPEPERRYPDARALGEDLTRLLEQRAVRATPDSTGYRLRSFVRRNRAGVTAAVGMFAALTAGLVTTLWQAERAAREAREAQRQTARAEAVRDFLLTVLEAGDRERSGGEDPRVSTIVERGAQRLQFEFTDDPGLQSEMAALLAQIDIAVGQYERASQLLDLADAGAARAESPDLAAAATLRRAVLENARGDPQKAAPLFETALVGASDRGQAANTLRVQVLSGWTYAMDNLGRKEEARARLEAELADANRDYSVLHRGELQMALATLLDDPTRKLAILEQAQADLTGQPLPLATEATLASMLGTAYRGVNQIDSMITQFERAVEIAERLYPGPSARRARMYNNLGSGLSQARRLSESDAQYAKAEAIYRELGDDRSPAFAALVHNRGLLLRELGSPEAGLPLVEQALELALQHFGARDRRTGLALRHVALLRAESTADTAADAEWRRALAIADAAAVTSAERYDLWLIGAQVAASLVDARNASERLHAASAAAKDADLVLTPLQRTRTATLAGVAESLHGNHAAALQALDEALVIGEELGEGGWSQRWRCHFELAQARGRAGDHAGAALHADAAARLLRQHGAAAESSALARLGALQQGH